MPIVKANGIDLFYEDYGNADDPVILLVMGLGTQLIAWPIPLIERLVARGFRVIRYDNRDVGKSTHFDGEKAIHPIFALALSKLGMRVPVAYTLTDMAHDATGLLDALGIARAHVVGASMGGMIAQLIAAIAPDRTLTLTSIMSTSGDPSLPGPSTELRRRLMARRPANPTREQALAMAEETLRAISYPDPARPDGAFREMAAMAYDRGGWKPLGTRRQLLAIFTDGNRAERLGRITAPTLLIHGAADPLVPKEGSESLARHIPHARLEVIEQMAHDLPPSVLPRIADLIADHAAAAA